MTAKSAVNVHDAKTRFSKLLEQVQRGRDVIIAKAGRPVARLTAYTAPARKIAEPGGMEGKGYWIAPDFDEPVDELFDVLREPRR
ncbi:MAG TPA: type II toxin-antitoxin system prevent-host-death family antitoxin [Nevskia sp.]|nr:type II toxin-antitoxin system prevent-host-death family antitoxin [Nevskia sp.]